MTVFATRRRVIVGYDGSAGSRAALEHAAATAGAEGCVFVVHAFPQPPRWLGEPYYQRRLDAALAKAESTMSELRVGEGGPLDRVAWEPEIIAGDPATVLASVASARRAHEIVVGTGRVARSLARLAESPVTVISDHVVRRLAGLAQAA